MSKMLRQKEKLIVTLILYAMIGWVVEVFATSIGGNNIGLKDWHYWTLMGNTSLWMMPVYVFGIGMIEYLNDQKWYYQSKMIWQTLIGGFCIGLVELISGIIINLWIGINAWSYFHEYGHILGQVCIKNFILFSLSVPLCIFLTDRIEWYLYRNEEDKELLVYSLFSIYKDLFTFK